MLASNAVSSSFCLPSAGSKACAPIASTVCCNMPVTQYLFFEKCLLKFFSCLLIGLFLFLLLSSLSSLYILGISALADRWFVSISSVLQVISSLFLCYEEYFIWWKIFCVYFYFHVGGYITRYEQASTKGKNWQLDFKLRISFIKRPQREKVVNAKCEEDNLKNINICKTGKRFIYKRTLKDQ